MKKKSLLSVLLAVLCLCSSCGEEQPPAPAESGEETTAEVTQAVTEYEYTEKDYIGMLPIGTQAKALTVNVFQNGTDGYTVYRIPSVTVSTQGTIHAFCEGRVDSSADDGNIDLVYKRSVDGGATWSALRVLAEYGENAANNATPVVDQITGRIWLFYALHTAPKAQGDCACYIYSDDDGITWSEQTVIYNVPHVFPGPGNGIQLTVGKYAGRLVIPMQTGFILYSDDHGNTWKGGIPSDSTHEPTVVELSDGRLMRNNRGTTGKREISYSSDGGKSWTPMVLSDELNEPITTDRWKGCQASHNVFFQKTENGYQRYLLFSNPKNNSVRGNLTIRTSVDDGESYPYSYTVYGSYAGYSSMAQYGEAHVVILYEKGQAHRADACLELQVIAFADLLK
ncbi:MAG: exo-alpha-sialidase [Ruminococcaceae bacterium]|nr:exo-alpha-sialidase [Oscillospiraceae bacterium]